MTRPTNRPSNDVSAERPELEVQVWRLKLDGATCVTLGEIEDKTSRLSLDETARADAIQAVDVATRWRAAHIALRLVLERTLGPTIRSVPLIISPRGKPTLDGHQLAFSLSHAANEVLIATSEFGAVGVDLEASRTVRMSDDRRQAIEHGAASLSGQPLPAEPMARFLQAWVRLEALAKAEGSGLAAILSQAGAYGPRRKVRLAAKDMHLPQTYRICDLAVGDGRFAAIAMPQTCTGVRVIDIPNNRDGLEAFVFGL